MRMKKTIGLILLLCGILSLSACQKESTENAGGKTGDIVAIKNPKETLDLEAYNLEYKKETDFQPFFQWSYCAKSENGYYFWNSFYDGGMIMFYDNTSKATVPLCNLPDCSHGEGVTSCNAYFNRNFDIKEDSFHNNDIQYYEGNLYTTGCDKNNNENIYKIAKDGSTREVSCRLYKAESSNSDDMENPDSIDRIAPSVCIHRGYAYFIDNSESMPKIRKVKLDSKEEPEIIYETSGVRPNLYRMEGYGDYIFFQAGNFTDETYSEIEGGVYAYNIITGNISLVKKGAISSYIIQNNMLYYSTDTTVNRYNIVSQEDEEFVKMEDSYPDVMADNNYIYVTDSSNTIRVYDRDKTKICTISLEDCSEYFYGDDEYLFAKTKYGVKILDKSVLKDGKPKWNSLY